MNGQNGQGNSNDIDTLGPRERGIDPDETRHVYVHRADDYTINSLNSFSFGNATTLRSRDNVSVDCDDNKEPELEAGEALEGEASPTVATVDVTPRPSVAHTHHDSLLHPSRRPRLPDSSSLSSSEAGSESNLYPSVSPAPVSPFASTSQATHTGLYSSNAKEDVEFSSDDDSYEFDNLDYPEGDDGEENIEISSARFSMTSGSTGFGYNSGYASYGPSEGFRDREGSVATLRIRSPDGGGGGDRDRSPPIFTSPFTSTSASTSVALVSPSASTSTHLHPSSDTAVSSPAHATPSGMDADFDFAYITSFGPDLSADPSSSVPDFVRPRRQSAISLSGTSPNHETSGRKDSLGKSLFFSWLSGRRPSTATVASTNSSNMFIHDDSFSRNLLKWGGEGYKEQRKDWTVRREAQSVSPSLPTSLNQEDKLKRVTTTSTAARPSTATSMDAGSSPNFLGAEQASSSHKEKEISHSHTKSQSHENFKDKDSKSEYSRKDKEKERLRRSTMHWRGMPIGSEEVWVNDLLGKFTVIREEVGRGAKAQDPTKGPQQRLLIRFRADSPQTRKASDQHLHLPHPPVTVHKHSKAMAFSLTRYFKPSHISGPPGATRARSTTPSEGPVTSQTYLPPRKITGIIGSDSPSAPLLPRATSNRIILLAPRRVQEAFTSTTTTKMLADHGLLSSGSGSVKRNERDGAHNRDGVRRKKSLPSDGGSVYRASPTPEKMRRKKSLSAPQSQSQSLTSSSAPPPPVPHLPTTSSAPSPSSSLAKSSPNTSKLAISAAPDNTTGEASSAYISVSESNEIPSSSSSASSTTPTSSTSLASSSTSVSQRLSSCTTNTDNTDHTEHTDRSSTLVDSEHSEMSSTSASESSASSRPPHRPRVPRRKWHEHDDHNENETDESSYDDDEQDDDLYGYRPHRDGGPSRVIRTPHSETYGTVDFSSANDRQRILQLVSESSSSSTSSFSILRFINRNVRTGVIDSLDPSASALRATAGPAFDPPWLTFPSRGKQEQQRRVVDNLNMSFKDVGLLPSTPRESHGRHASSSVGRSTRGTITSSGRRKSVSGGGKSKRDKVSSSKASSDPSQDVFASVPPESLCMLLPLWPGDTDPPSQVLSQHIYPPSQSSFKKHVIPLEKRTFLLVWYKALEPQLSTSKGGKDSDRKGGLDSNKEEVALAVIDSLIGLSPNAEKEKEKEKKEKRSKSNASRSTGSGKDSGKDSGKSSHTSPTSSSDSTGFLRSSRSLGGLGIGSSSGRGTGTGTGSANASGSYHHSNSTWAQVHGNDERNILLPGFLVTARRVSYHDLQGTGVRVPDEGVTVNGPLEEAWRECFNIPDSMSGITSDPGTSLTPSFMPDPTILAVCHSRESGVEFDPEALISLGLCRVLNPLPMGMVAEDFVENGPIPGEGSPGNGWGFGGMELKLKLTPVGRAIMEMCWVGGLALTSFGPS